MPCCCTKHEEFTEGKQFTILKIGWKKIKKQTLNSFVKLNLLTQRQIENNSTKICTECVSYVDNNTQYCKTVSDVIDLINNNNCSETELSAIASALGKHINKNIYEDSISITSQYKDEEYLKAYNVEEWIQCRNSVLTSFLKSATKTADDVMTHKQNCYLARCIECIYNARNSQLIAPLSFATNLLVYFITGSRSACEVISGSSPSGSYTSILNWIKNKSSNPLQCPNDVDCVTFFDNNQVLARNWRVRFDYKSLVSVITSVIHIFPNNNSLPPIQTNPHFSPEHWLTFSKDSIMKAGKQLLESAHQIDTFRQHRSKFLHMLINKVYSEQHIHNGACTDSFDIPPDDVKSNRTQQPVKIETAHVLEGKLKYQKISNLPNKYDIVEKHQRNPPKVLVGNPIMCNPCSYQSMHKVMENIQDTVCKHSDRKWTIIGCDGLPYNLASRVIQNSFVCSHCNETIDSELNFEKHVTMLHGAELTSDVAHYRKFNNILLVSGPGHFEINMTKAIFKLMWNVILKDLALMLGFRSPKALTTCEKATDHHKSMQILEIALFGTLQEILIPYIRECVCTQTTPDVNGFHSWLTKITNPNIKYLVDTLLTYVLCVYLFRAGLRRGDNQLVTECKYRFSDIFFGLNMTQYQEIMFREIHMNSQCPAAVAEFLHNTQSFTCTGSENKGEGGDFILEAKNRRMKMWMPPGLPTQERWERICRNLDNLEQVQQQLTQVLGLPNTDANYMYHVNLDLEINQWRRKLRKAGYVSEPFTTDRHVSLSGTNLDMDLCNFIQKCEKNKESYVHAMECGKKIGSIHKTEPIFISPLDRSKYMRLANKPKADIVTLIMEQIDEIRNTGALDVAESLLNAYKADIKNGTKDVLITFLKDATQVFENIMDVFQCSTSGHCIPRTLENKSGAMIVNGNIPIDVLIKEVSLCDAISCDDCCYLKHISTSTCTCKQLYKTFFKYYITGLDLEMRRCNEFGVDGHERDSETAADEDIFY